MSRLPPGFSWQRQRFEPMHVLGEMQTSDVLDRALCCRKIGACGERRLQSVHRLPESAQAQQHQPEFVPGAGQCGSLAARRTQALCRGAQTVVDTRAIPRMSSRIVERLHGLVAAPASVIDQTEKLQRHRVVRDRLHDSVCHPFGLDEIPTLMESAEKVKQCVDHP